MFISSALFAYRTKKHNTTRHEPFYLLYGREAVLPIEFAIITPQAELFETDLQDDLLKRVQMITGRITEDRLEAQDIIHKAQVKQKHIHDKDLREVKFKIGDLVLLYKSQLREKKKLQDEQALIMCTTY